MKTTNEQTTRNDFLLYGAVSLTLLTSGLAILAWGQDNGWQLLHLSIYQLFPIFGLLAFSIMWSQYVMAAIKDYLGKSPEVIKRYFDATGWLVLFAILLHPGLLIAQRYHDGYGLPPGSYESYVAPMQRWLTILGSVSLLMFLAFELKRFYRDRPWWKYIVLLNDLAILAIFYHGLRLGQDIGHHWFQAIWYLYGIILIPILVFKYVTKWQKRRES